VSTAEPTWEIHNALARLAHLADSGDIEEYLEQFTEDAVWEVPEVPQTGTKADRRSGRASIRDGVVSRRAAGIQGPGSATQHTVHTIEVRPGADGTATSHAYYAFYGTTTTAPALIAAGQYHDTWKLADGGWKLAHRRIVSG
jgi:3-phenylpropionate/cinnamic acid dioxygenase small subunit